MPDMHKQFRADLNSLSNSLENKTQLQASLFEAEAELEFTDVGISTAAELEFTDVDNSARTLATSMFLDL